MLIVHLYGHIVVFESFLGPSLVAKKKKKNQCYAEGRSVKGYETTLSTVSFLGILVEKANDRRV